MWTCCFAYAGPDLFHLILGTDLTYLPCHLQSFSSYTPKCLQGDVQNGDPCITILPVAHVCCALTWHLDTLPSFTFYCCRHIVHLVCFLVTFNFCCPQAQTSKANRSSFRVWVGWKPHSLSRTLNSFAGHVRSLCQGKYQYIFAALWAD